MSKIDFLYKQLESDILNRKYLVGEKLPSENQLITKHKVSRNVVRSALAKLAHEGYVNVTKRVGYFIASQDYWAKGLSYSVKYKGEITNTIQKLDQILDPFFIEKCGLNPEDFYCYKKNRIIKEKIVRISYLWFNKKLIKEINVEEVKESAVKFLKKKFLISISTNEIKMTSLPIEDRSLFNQNNNEFTPGIFSYIQDDDYGDIVLCSLDFMDNENFSHCYKANL